MEIKAAGVRVVIAAVMLLMSMAGPAVTGRWLPYRKASMSAQHSAAFRQSASCSSPGEADPDWENIWDEPSCQFCHEQLMIDGAVIFSTMPPLRHRHPPLFLATFETNVHPPMSRACAASSGLPGKELI